MNKCNRYVDDRSRDEGLGIKYLYASLEHKVDAIDGGPAMLERHGLATIRSF